MDDSESTSLVHTELDTLEATYHAWLELKLQYGAFRAAAVEQKRKLEEHGNFILGAVRAARTLPPEKGGASAQSLMKSDVVGSFIQKAEAELKQGRDELDRRLQQAESEHIEKLAAIKAHLRGQVERFAEKVRPNIVIRRRKLANGSVILHLDRLSPDESVLAMYIFTMKLPTRHGFLLDDSTDDASLPPPQLYPDEGVLASRVRPSPAELRDLIVAGRDFVPVKAMLPLLINAEQGGVDVVRFLMRGAVLEGEILEGDAFRNMLTQDEAERVVGALIRSKLAERIELEVLAE